MSEKDQPGAEGSKSPNEARREQIANITKMFATKAATNRDVRLVNRTRRRRKFPLNSTEDIERADRRLDLSLKRLVAWFAIVAVTAQLAVADLVFWKYASTGLKWVVPTPAMQAWLAATVVQTIGILYVIARYLFPRRDTSPSDDDPSA